VAQNRLSEFEEQKRAAAAAQDRSAWDQAIALKTAAGSREYLAAFPDGAFAEEARTRIEALTAEQENSKELQAAKLGEDRMGLNAQTRTLIEGRLTALGLKPGPVDGVFDDRTRRAIRRYQEVRELPVTGYLNQGTVVRLLADSILK
jgi:peptidoglycan hydrolase-like protein with peptidoglycan-binding domain